MEIFALITYALIGAVSGFFAGLLGIGGGIIIVPALVLVFHLIHFPQEALMHAAIGTSLASIVIASGVATFAHHRKQGVMWDVIFLMFPGLLMGCLLGGFVASFLSGVLLQIVFGLFILALGAYVLLNPRKRRKQGQKKPQKALLTWGGLGIGATATMLGIGGGVFTVPLLMGYHYPEKKAVGTSSAASLMITLLGSLAYFYFGKDSVHIAQSLGYLYIPAFVLIGLAATFAAPLGVKCAHQMEGKKLRVIFAGTLILVGIVMVFN